MGKRSDFPRRERDFYPTPPSAIGRVKWIPDSKHTSKDSVCWYLFNQVKGSAPRFYGRGLKEE